MSIVVLLHDPNDPPARLGSCLRDHGHELDCRLLHEGDALPGDLDNVDGVLVMGGSMNVDDEDEYHWLQDEKVFIKQAIDAELPTVGLCLGSQLIADAMGGTVEKMDTPEVGFHNVKLAFPGTVDPILAGVPWDVVQFHAHGYQVTALPPGATPLAGSQACRTQAFCIGSPAYVYAFQYHFEWSKKDITTWLDSATDWLSENNIDTDAVKSSLDEHYDLYKHMGDRHCKRIADLLYKIDKRLAHKSGPITSFDPAVS